MDIACGYYHPGQGDQRFVLSVDQVFDTTQMRARPIAQLSQEELTTNVLDIVLENPNHVKEFLYNNKQSSLRAPALI